MKVLLFVLTLAVAAIGCGDDSNAGGTGGAAGGSGGSAGMGGATGGSGGATGGSGGATGGSGGSTGATLIGSTTWRATTDPPNGVTGSTGGCTVFVTLLSTDIFVDVELTLDVYQDGDGNILTEWSIVAQNALLSVAAGLANVGGLSAAATVTTGTPDSIPSMLTTDATGVALGDFLDGNILTLSTPAEITQGSAAVTSGDATVDINWDGTYTLTLTNADGSPLIVVDESVCVFDVQGDAVTVTL